MTPPGRIDQLRWELELLGRLHQFHQSSSLFVGNHEVHLLLLPLLLLLEQLPLHCLLIERTR